MNGLMVAQYPLVGYGGFLFLPMEAPVFLPGTRIAIISPITSRSNADVKIKVKIIIYEGSVWPGHGTKLVEYTSPEQTISPNTTLNFTFYDTCVKGSIDRRDLGIEVSYWDGTKWVVDGTWEGDDAWYVRPLEYIFEIGTPVVQAA